MSGRSKVAAGIGAAIVIGLAASAVMLLQRNSPSNGQNGNDGAGRRPEFRSNLPKTETPGAVEGEVQTRNGSPVEGASVTPFMFDSGSRRGDPVTTDAAGLFRIEQLPPGTYSLRAERDGGGTALATPVVVEPNGLNRLTSPMVLLDGAGLQVMFLDSKGKAHSGVAVVLYQKLSSEPKTARLPRSSIGSPGARSTTRSI